MGDLPAGAGSEARGTDVLSFEGGWGRARGRAVLVGRDSLGVRKSEGFRESLEKAAKVVSEPLGRLAERGSTFSQSSSASSEALRFVAAGGGVAAGCQRSGIAEGGVAEGATGLGYLVACSGEAVVRG